MQIVPSSLGSVQVWAAVRSAEVKVPVKALVVTVDCGLMAMESEPAVDEEKVALLDPVRVTAKEPEVEVKLRAPVVRVKPFEAVKLPAEVIPPDEVVTMLPVVEMVILLAKSPPTIDPVSASFE